jgi:hypothetical protein
VSEFKLNLLNRLHLIWEIITTRSGHKHSSSSKQLSTFQQGYSAGVEDERYNTKDLERQLAEVREEKKKVLRWMKKYLNLPDGHKCIGHSDLYEMYHKLKEQEK